MKEVARVISRDEIKEATLKNIIDMGLEFSAMIRLFEKRSKEKIHEHMITTIKRIFKAESEEKFRRIHTQFCEWGKKSIQLAKESEPASYGQIAKTLDVVLKVAVYCCRLPEGEKAKKLSQWLNAAVDTEMMRMLRECYPEAIERWPRTIKQVKENSYLKIQETVHKFILEKHQGSIIPVEFDVYYWWKLNREKLQPNEP